MAVFSIVKAPCFIRTFGLIPCTSLAELFEPCASLKSRSTTGSVVNLTRSVNDELLQTIAIRFFGISPELKEFISKCKGLFEGYPVSAVIS